MLEKLQTQILSIKEIFSFSAKFVHKMLPRLITLSIIIEIISLPFLSVIDEAGAVEYASKPFMATTFAIITILATAIGLVMLFKIEEAFVNNKHMSLVEAFSQSKKIFIPFILTAILCDIIISLGFSLFLIPGIIIFTFLVFAYHAAALRGKYFLDAMKYSINLVKDRFLHTLIMVLILLTASTVLTIAVIMFDALLGYVLSIFGSVGYFLSAIISFLLFFIPGIYIFIAYTVFFLNIDYVFNRTHSKTKTKTKVKA